MLSWTALGAFVLGALSGVLSALAGVGGAVITTPGIRVLGATPIQAVGSTVPPIIPGAVAGAIRYWREGLVDIRVGVTCGLAGVVSALGGVWVSDHVNGHLLMVITALLAIWSSIATFRGPRIPREGVADPEHHIPFQLLVAAGAGGGFIAGLLGVGGGVVMVPTFTTLFRMPIKRTIATSLVTVAMMSISSLVGHWVAGHIDWTFGLPLALGAIPGARLGSRYTTKATDARMRIVSGTLLGVIGVVYLVSELTKL